MKLLSGLYGAPHPSLPRRGGTVYAKGSLNVHDILFLLLLQNKMFLISLLTYLDLEIRLAESPDL